jgi:UDP-glucose 4-epimerase
MTRRGVFDPILVTGGNGFIGACTVRELLNRDHEVHLVLRDPPRAWRLTGILPRVTVHQGDLADAEQTRAAVVRSRAKAVFHLATHGAYESQADARAILRTNVLGTYNLLEASAEAGVRVFVNAGSSSEYGYQSRPMQETCLLDPNSFYAVAKACQSHLCALAARKWPMGVAVFRLFSVYGPWETPTRLMPTLIRRARAGLPLEMVAPGIARDFVYVDDVVEALLDLPRLAQLRGELINLGSGIETTLSEVVKVVTDLIATSSEVRWKAMRPRPWDTTRWCADATKAARILDWRARHTLRDGLKKMASWMQARGDCYGPEAAERLLAAG